MYICICICIYIYICICICICFFPVLYPYPAIAKSGSASSPEPWLSATPLRRRRRPFSSRWDARWDARWGQEGPGGVGFSHEKLDEKWAVNGISWPKLWGF